jgi:NitT/TauT family transport system ATP-binding protein
MAATGAAAGRTRIDVVDVYKEYGTGRSTRAVVAGCSFSIEPGRFTVLIGPSGAGKSTLLRLIAGFEKPTHGQILAGGKPITGPSKERQVVFQESALFPWMTARDNVRYGPDARGERTPRVDAASERLLEKVGLRAFGSKYPMQLSGGMQRRAELVRALVNEPLLLLLDEPFRGLDAMTRKLMLEYYSQLSEASGRTTCFVTTDVDEAIFLADRLLVMTHIPTRVRASFDVDLPRPRQLAGLVGDDAANALKREVLSLLHEEAMKAFVGGSQAAADFVAAYQQRLGS